ncbi:hypothetical protein QTR44_001705 [Salmonella enterica]|nr:hypothetical protein [Salmonella enterica]EEP1814451.1 hypothetical protein [Salmonella enterica subsp. enterica serovar Kentucky]EGC2583925.1 hypothetical protein [Salmonella enterica subsp. enterica]EGM2332890.1 hypothetical protein [Salmonella enterica]EHR9792723.1 hypothetical protein [Salmonella enterica]
MMLSVVAGHIANFPFGEVFYYYQVAGFFLLSGYFFHYDKYADRFSKFLKSRSKLICQYLIYSAIIIYRVISFITTSMLTDLVNF